MYELHKESDGRRTRLLYEREGFFSGAVLVAKDGEVVLSKGYGMANLEHSVPNTPHTKFRLASVTKPFTAAAILWLQQRQRLHVEDLVSKYVPTLPNGNRITVHHLLSHTSGLDHPPGISDTKRWQTEELVNAFADKPMLFSPGERFQYRSSNYILLTYILETVAGQTYDTFLKDNLFRPLGMNDSGFDVQSGILPNRAAGYRAFEDRWVNGRLQDMSVHSGAAGLYSTTGDLYLWDQALYSDQLLDARSREAMFTAYKGNYGYGWYIDELSMRKNTVRRMYHGGLNDGGFFTRITRFPESRVLIVLLCNFLLSPQERINRDLAAALFGESYERPEPFPRSAAAALPATNPEAYVGTYEAFVPFVIKQERSRLFISIFGFKLELFLVTTTEDRDEFRSKAAYVRVVFKRNAGGKVTEALLSWLGEEESAASKK